MKKPNDVVVYVESMKRYIFGYEEYMEMLNESGIQDRNKFETLLIEIIEIMAMENYLERNNPELSFDQFDDSMKYAVTDYHLECLQEKGMIESYINEDNMEIFYQPTEKGRVQNLLNNINYN